MEPPSNDFGALAHTVQTKMPVAPTLREHCRVDALSVVPDVRPKLPFAIVEFHFDVLRLDVREGIAQCLPAIR